MPRIEAAFQNVVALEHARVGYLQFGRGDGLVAIYKDIDVEEAGAFGESVDGLPVIDAVPNNPHCFTVMGFGGNGTIYSMIAAGLMPGLLNGRLSNDARTFRFRE